jgi:plasmid stabilization system protein ParE
MKKPIKFVAEAEAEYLAALTWYHERSPATAVRFEAEVDRAVREIQKSPARWMPYLGCRRFLLHHFPFAIIYEDSPTLVRILAVAHCHRKPDYWQKRI